MNFLKSDIVFYFLIATVLCLLGCKPDNTPKTGFSAPTWLVSESSIPDGEGFKSLFFLDDNRGWVGGRSGLFKTEDAGATWKRVPFDLPADSEVTGIWFFDPANGLVVTGSNFPLDRSKSRTGVYATRDGGVNWTTAIARTGLEVYDWAVDASNRLWLSGSEAGSEADLPCRRPLMIMIASGAARIMTGFTNSFPLRGRGCNEFGLRIAFNRAGEIFCITGSKRIVRSRDSGESWQMSEKIDLENPEMGVGGFGIKDDGSVWYSDSARGTEGVKSRLFVNGKANWSFGEFLSPVISTESGHFIAARSDRRIGDSDLSGVLVFSSDDGQSWTPITKPYQTEFKTLAPDIRNRNVFRALTANGRVIRLEVRDLLAN